MFQSQGNLWIGTSFYLRLRGKNDTLCMKIRNYFQEAGEIMMKDKDTFAAIATSAMNPGSIGIVRMSGSEAFAIIQKIFVPKNSDRFAKMESHTVHYGHIVSEGAVVDEVMVLIMKGPKTFTAEDTVEINCHGGLLVTRKVLETVIMAGARVAEPGEFTKHAFLNGRIDLSEAEAVMEVISAENDFALKSSLSQLQGSVSRVIRQIRDEILDGIAYIEAALDDPEHISLLGYEEILSQKIKVMQEDIEKLLCTADDGIMLKEGVKTVILGKPNAGKSSLLNLLLGKERAIVTEIPGTTRDTLSEQIRIGDIQFLISDTAGIRKTEDTVESIGVKRSLEEAKDADLILYLVDSSDVLDENDEEILDFIQDKKTIVIYNKVDLMGGSKENLLKLLLSRCPNADLISMSTKEGIGFDALKDTMVGLFEMGDLSYNPEVMITSVRHKEALLLAKNSLCSVQEGIESGISEDFWTIDLQDAYEALGKITGETIEDDVANRIFEKFCMGK